MNSLLDTLRYFLIILSELTALFLLISTVIALGISYTSPEKMKQLLAKRGFGGNFIGALIGAITPFCACSTIPMTLGFLNMGAPFGAVMSFVIASPILNPIIIGMIATLGGVKASLLYFIVVFFAAIIFGIILEKTGGAQFVKSVRIKKNNQHTISAQPTHFSGKLKAAFITAWSDFRAILLYLIIGVWIGAIIYGYIPQEFITRIAGNNNPVAIPIAALVGIPLYIRAETAIPIGLALTQKGMSLGAVIALIIGGAGMAIPEMTMLASIFKKRLVLAIVLVIFLTAIITGLVFNYFI